MLAKKKKRTTPSQKIQRDLNEQSKHSKSMFNVFGIVENINRNRTGLCEKAKPLGKARSTDFETAWLKQPGKLPELATRTLALGSTPIREPKPLQTMDIHSHPREVARPSLLDLKTFVKSALNSKKKRSSVIVVTQRGKLVGYTFMTIRDPKKAKAVLEIAGRPTSALQIAKIRTLGINIRFVPIKGYKFNPKTKKFSKIAT